jgi:choline dehydrogenase-like flavoprotein
MSHESQVLSEPTQVPRTELVVIGSGPGGALTACLAAEAGRDVLLLEEGPYIAPDRTPPFTRAEMIEKYRCGGITVAMGAAKVTYVEGCCVGGASEINSGLYHRTPPEILAEWRDQLGAQHLRVEDLEPHFAALEHELSVGNLPGPAPLASLKLRDGATALGWRAIEAQRWFQYHAEPGLPPTKQTMTRTFIPRFLAAGGKLLPNCRIDRLRRDGSQWRLSCVYLDSDGPKSSTIHAPDVFVAGGAVQTPALLQRSRIASRAGRRLRLHPTLKVVARFPEQVNSLDMGVPVHQVPHFAPRYRFGCAISSPPFLAIALNDHPDHEHDLANEWPRMACYYAMTRGGSGSVRTLPYYRDPLVRYRLNTSEIAELSEALVQLCRCLFAAGAETLFPTIAGCPTLRSPADLEKLASYVVEPRLNLTTVHLFASCPLGEDRQQCVVDSFGRVHGVPHLHLADASMLGGPTSVNPQATIMALARRNVLDYLQGGSDPS